MNRRKSSISKRFYEIAKKNYPENWNIEMVKNLVKLGRITIAEYKDITGEDYIKS